MSGLKDQILSRIGSDAGPKVWTVNDFLDLGGYDAVHKTMQRLASAGDIRRIDDGLYRQRVRSPDMASIHSWKRPGACLQFE